MRDDVVAELERVRARIEDPERWCTQVLARNVDGAEVGPENREAVRWCIQGAADREQIPDVVWDLLEDTSGRLYGLPMPADVNDAVGHAAVLRVLDEAERRAREEAHVE